MNSKYVAGILFGILLQINVSAHSSKDSLVVSNRNSIYWNTSKVFGDVFGLNNYWLAGGVRMGLTKKLFLDISFGGIIYSYATDPGIGSIGPHVLSSSGFQVGAEPIYFQNNKFYYSVAFFYESMKSPINFGEVNREVYALTPKVGFRTSKKHSIYCDFSIGIGVRIISSYNSAGLTSQGYVEYEIPYDKPFAFGTQVFPNFLLDVKLHIPFPL